MGPFLGYLVCCPVRFWFAGGTGPGNSVSLRKNKEAGVACFIGKVRTGMVKKASLGVFSKPQRNTLNSSNYRPNFQ